MTTERNIIIHAGQAFTLSLDYAGTAGRGQRMHIRASDAADDVIAILTHNGADNARVIYNDATQKIDITIGASVSGAWLVGANRVEWKYDIEDYDVSDDDDIDIPFRGASIVYGNRTRPEDVTPSAALPSGDGRYVRYDGEQGLSDEQKLQARENIGAGTGGGGGSVEWGDVTGTLSDQTDLNNALAAKAPLASPTFTGTPAAPTAAGGTSTTQIATTAFVGSAVSTHAGATDPHGDRAYADSLAVNYATAAQGALADSAVQDVAAEIHAATAASLADADEQGFWQSASSALRKISWANVKAAIKTYADTLYAAISHTHSASDVTSGTFDSARLPAATETAQGAVELATTAEALTGTDTTRAVTPAGVKAVADTKAASSHTHAASDITSGTLDAARLPAATTSAQGAVELATVAECQAGTDTTRATTPEGVAAAIAALGLAQPLTTVRATRQTSALTAAASGEVKFQFRDAARAGILAIRSDVSEEQIVLPSTSNPYVTGAWVENGNTIRAKGQNSATVSTATGSTILSGSVCAVNLATAASAGSGSIWYNNGVFQLRDGSAAGDGYLAWGLVSYPDSDYGSGSTGCVLRLGLYASGASTTDGTRCSGRSAFLEYNTVQGDTNWTLCVHNGTDMATSSTGVAFAAAKTWFFIIHSPRGGSSTYAYIYNVTDGSGGGTSLARNTGSTALSMYTGVITRTTVARNMRFQSMYARVGGQI